MFSAYFVALYRCVFYSGAAMRLLLSSENPGDDADNEPADGGNKAGGLRGGGCGCC